MVYGRYIKYKTVFFLVLLCSALLGLSACSTTEEEEFRSAFDAPMAAGMEETTYAHEQTTNPQGRRLLTATTNAQPTVTPQPADPLVVSSKSLPVEQPARQSEEEALQLDWSNVKRWSGNAQPQTTATSKTQETSDKQSVFIEPLPVPQHTAAPVVQRKSITRPALRPAEISQQPRFTNAPYTSETLLSAGDTVDIAVYGEDELSGSYLLDSRGVMTVPLVGEIRAAGLSKTQLQNIIASSLKSGGFLERPYVTATISRLQPIYILGEVRTPGQYDYEPTLDVFKAIALAGGYTPRAAKNKIFITRLQNGKKVEISADEHTDLLPGDSILIKQRFF